MVQPGVVNADAGRRGGRSRALRTRRIPGSWESSTIGGNVATNAGGMCCVKYGVTTEYVLGLEVVLASGEVLRTGRRTAKGVAGYDLTRLFVGSEGTLGVITEITVALRPAPEESLTLVAVFRSTAAAGAAVAEIAARGLTPSLLELLDQTHLRAIEAYRPMGLRTDAQALLLAAADTGPRAAEDLAALAAVCDGGRRRRGLRGHRRGGGGGAAAGPPAGPPGDGEVRRRAYPGGNGGLIIDDVAVPRGALAALLDGVARIAAECEVPIGVVGHAGDGNMHPNIVVDRADPASVERGRRAFDEIMQLGLDLGGTCTGEHGVGLLKRDWLAREIGPVGVRVHQAIKAALDPAGLLNPGKVL